MRFLSTAFFLPLAVLAITTRAAEPVTLHWLDGTAPAAPVGVSWGVPWPKGAVQPTTPMHLTTAGGQRLEVQTWPVAFWPDGSVKWTGHALAANAGLNGPFTLTPLATTDAPPALAIKISEDDDAFTIDTGAVRARVGKRRSYAIQSLTIGKIGRAHV